MEKVDIQIEAVHSEELPENRRPRRPFHGHTKRDFDLKEDKFWLAREPHKLGQRNIRIAQWIGFAFGFILIGAVALTGTMGLPQHKFCLIFDDNFEDLSNWSHDVELGGFGHGTFDWTTSSEANSFLQDGRLKIIPTLTQIEQQPGTKVNLTMDGTCTSDIPGDCATSFNYTTHSVINPVQSARLSTLKSNKTIKYGKVEVKAKFPKGDWLRPTIQLLPVEQYYGPWLYSGELVMASSRGNDVTYSDCGIRCIQTRLNVGKLGTEQHRDLSLSDLSQEDHVYGLIWTPEYIMTYLDSPTNVIFLQEFVKDTLWQWMNRKWTHFATLETKPIQPNLYADGTSAAPFDKEFYLTLGVQVGGVDGVFPDGLNNKPWADTSGREAAMGQFFYNTQKWNSTWANVEARTMSIDSVRMWRMC